MLIPSTGPPALRISASQILAGTSAWLEYFNERGGHRGQRIELLIEDSGYDIAKTANAIRKLAEEAGVLALLNSNGTPQLAAAMPYIQSRRLPLLLPFAGEETWYYPPQWGVFGVQAPFNDIGRLLGQWAALEGHQRVAVLYPDYPELSSRMAQQACLGFNAAKPGEDARISNVCVPLGSENGGMMADAILDQNPDAMIVLVNWLELVAAAHELYRRGRKLQLYSWSANVTQHVASRGAATLEGMKGYAEPLFGPTAETSSARTYRAAMAQYFPKQPPDFLSMTAFARAMVFTSALNQISGEVDADSIVDAFESLDNLETGLLPPVTFTPSRHIGVREVQAMQLREGIWQTIRTTTMPLVAAKRS